MITCALINLPNSIPCTMITIALAMLLSVSEVLSVTERWDRELSYSFSIAILPLLIIFLVIVVSEVQTY